MSVGQEGASVARGICASGISSISSQICKTFINSSLFFGYFFFCDTICIKRITAADYAIDHFVGATNRRSSCYPYLITNINLDLN